MLINPLFRSYVKKFKTNKRGYYSFIIFMVIFILSLFAEFIANDKPLLISYNNKLYFPIIKSYPETTFGGILPTPTDYQDSFIIEQINSHGFMIMPPIPFSYNSINYKVEGHVPSPPSLVNLLGTDDQGRDVAARLIYGFRVSVLFGIILTFFSSIIGVFVGAIQGYFGGRIDLFMQRFMEVWSGLPQLFLLVLVASVFYPSFFTLLCVMLLFSWTSLVGVVRAEFLRTRNFDYVRSAYALGVSDWLIIFRHILPNAMIATITYLPFILCGAIIALTALEFLGMGLPPGTASLGELLRQGKENIDAPWLGISGFIVLAFILSLLIFIGEAFRDAFDSRKDIR